ncbi:MAG: TetR/AcrR family transcriptional regulator [Aeromicrobium sp.]
MAYRRTPAVERRLEAARARILGAATALVADCGYSGCSMAAVAKNAEVATGTVYGYFPNKGELFAEVFRNACTREVAAASAAGAAVTDNSYVSSIVASIKTFAERALMAPTLAYALLAEPVDPLVDAERLAFRESFGDALAAATRLAIYSGEIPDQNADITGSALVGAIGEALVMPLAKGNADPDVVPALIAFTIRSLGGTHDKDTRSDQPGPAAGRLRRG